MYEEMKSLHKNNTYELMELPKGKRALKNKWKKCIDFEEIFSPVVKMSSIRVVFGLATSMNLEIEQLDVKTVFLHGDLEEEIYMERPKGFTIKGKETLVCRLKKSLYGLKQAPRQWYKKFDSFMVEHRGSSVMAIKVADVLLCRPQRLSILLSLKLPMNYCG
ncbi:Retrovirus-related Pol polyprotein from transposon TNT 1-94 [Vitis vinifera]|uniref:Retrovirus-related Pol polyprotein from transposon TNT 1-94 n=1 Tax=Vitis vinifera TaxID=29760 RepID=A0A438J359_VITVI|nr:Retrovirus-related Pol polyprotein from transposon TNT 1-94 [Vitis vinifera]